MQHFIFKDKEGNDLKIVSDIGQVAAMLQDPELVKPMDGSNLEVYLVANHMKIIVEGVEYIHKGCSWGIANPEVYVYQQI